MEGGDGGHPLSEAHGSLARVVLASSPANSEAFENDSQSRVAGPAIPEQVFRRLARPGSREL